jgi:cell division protein FtsN
MSFEDDENDAPGYGPSPDDPIHFDASDGAYGRGRFVLILAMVAFVAAIGIVYVVYQQGVRQGGRDTPPIITAEAGPEKVTPEDPGGAIIEHQDKLVYDQISGEERPQVEVLLPESEEPLDLSDLKTGGGDSSELIDDASSEIDISAPGQDENVAEVATPEPKPEPEPEKTVASLIEETSEPVTQSSGSAISGDYVVQVGAYDAATLASAAWDAMQKKHGALLGTLRPDVQVADLGSKGTWYRLRVGPFNDKDSAQNLCTSLKAQGQDCLVREP